MSQPRLLAAIAAACRKRIDPEHVATLVEHAGEVAVLEEACRVAADRARALTDERTAAQDALQSVWDALGDGWHNLKSGGAMLLADGQVIALSDRGESWRRQATEREAQAAIGVDRNLTWEVHGFATEASTCDDIPF